MLTDINRNTGRNLDIIEAKIKEIKMVVSESERKLALMRNDLEKQRAVANYQQQLDSASPFEKGNFSKNVAEKYRRSSQPIGLGLRADESYSVTSEGKRHVSQQQADLFDQVYETPVDENKILSNTGTYFSVDSNGSSVASVPVLGPNVSYADTPIVPKKEFNESVKELYIGGNTVDEIASKLNSSTTEVQLVIDMNM